MAPSVPDWIKRFPSVGGSDPSQSSPPPPPCPEAVECFKAFVEAQSFPDILRHFSELLGHIKISPGRFCEFFPKFKHALMPYVPFRYKEIFKILETKYKQKPYEGMPAEKQRVLVVGAGPCGMRTAIEVQLLGAKTIVIEKREDFTRHNILKLWKFLVADFKMLGIKKFVGKFCAGPINHIGIKTLQLFLAKVTLMLGVQVEAPIALLELVEPSNGAGWKAKYSKESVLLDSYEFDMLVVASGKKVAVEGFNRRSLDAKLSIAVTANLLQQGTPEEAAVEQISGISKQYHQV